MIDAFPANWQTQLQETLTDWQSDLPARHVHLLLDAAHHPHLLKLPELRLFTYINLFQQAGISGDVEGHALSPILLEARLEQLADLLRLIGQCDGLPMLSLWHTSESLEQLASRLLPWCIVSTDAQLLMLHFADTRILPALAVELDTLQRGQFFGSAHAVMYQHRDGLFHSIALPDTPQTCAEKVSLTEAQVHALLKAGEADGTLHILHTTQSMPASEASHFWLYTTVNQTLNLARKADMTHFPDRLALVRHILQQPKRFENLCTLAPSLKNPDINTLLEQLT